MRRRASDVAFIRLNVTNADYVSQSNTGPENISSVFSFHFRNTMRVEAANKPRRTLQFILLGNV